MTVFCQMEIGWKWWFLLGVGEVYLILKPLPRCGEREGLMGQKKRFHLLGNDRMTHAKQGKHHDLNYRPPRFLDRSGQDL
jgi:hypothetical protein